MQYISPVDNINHKEAAIIHKHKKRLWAELLSDGRRSFYVFYESSLCLGHRWLQPSVYEDPHKHQKVPGWKEMNACQNPNHCPRWLGKIENKWERGRIIVVKMKEPLQQLFFSSSTICLFDKCHVIFNDHRESWPQFNVSSERWCFLTV